MEPELFKQLIEALGVLDEGAAVLLIWSIGIIQISDWLWVCLAGAVLFRVMRVVEGFSMAAQFREAAGMPSVPPQNEIARLMDHIRKTYKKEP